MVSQMANPQPTTPETQQQINFSSIRSYILLIQYVCLTLYIAQHKIIKNKNEKKITSHGKQIE